jgi:hypothetical protein
VPTQEQLNSLLERMRAMSAADLSVLEASANTPDSNMTTAPGSANEALWTAFAGFGWVGIKEDALDLPDGKKFVMKIYTITREGLQPILNLLAALAQK